MRVILDVRDLSVNYGATEVLKNVSFSVHAGEYIGLAGPNGAGKTTLIKAILGLAKHAKGTIELFGQCIHGFEDWSKIGYLPQSVITYNPLFPATVREVVGLGLLSQKKFPKRVSSGDRAKIDDALELLDIINLEDRLVSELSGGQQQRVFLARALVSNPELLILDEPGTALDPHTREKFFRMIKEINQTKGVSIILITHDLSDLGKNASRLLYLDKEVVFYGKFSDYCASQKMSKYFGEYAKHLICHQHS
jgi:zinc transport system ATP-binding protein